MRHIREETLLTKAIDGDREAFDTLVERYKTIVYGFAYYRVRNHEDARDIAQNVFVNVFLNLQRLKDQSKFGPWLRRITVNVCGVHARQKHDTEQLDPMLMEPDKVSSLLTKLAVEQALSCLSEQTRLTLTLYYFSSYSHNEIASFLDIPVTAVKSRLRDGRARLKKDMMDMVESTLHEKELGIDFDEQVKALIDASIKGNIDTVRDLLIADNRLVSGLGMVADEHIEFMRSEDADGGWTPLHLAAHYGNLDIVRLLIEYGADIEAVSKNAIANTPISAAAWGNHLDIVDYLLDSGANVNATNSWGSTALRRAIDANRESLAALLLARGADPHIKNNEGQSPLDTARENGRDNLVRLLLRYETD